MKAPAGGALTDGAPTDPNDIVHRQDRPEFLKLQHAKRALYDAARRWYYAQIACLVAIPLVLAALKLAVPAAGPYGVLAAVAVSALDFWLLEPRQKARRTLGARMQEQFDRELFRLPWEPLVAGARPEPADVEHWAARGASADGLRGWYRPEVGALPPGVARLTCQQSSAQWNRRMRGRYARLLTAGAVAVLVAVGVAAVATGATALDLGVWAGTLAPLWAWALKEARRQDESVAASARIADHVARVLERARAGQADAAVLDVEARAVQVALYRQRASDPQVPGPMYWRYRAEDERAARANVRGAVDLHGRAAA